MIDTISHWPNKACEFQNHHMDSTRWDDFAYRDGDVVIGTWAKSGTTWVQQIVGQFIFDGAKHVPVLDLSPWLEYRPIPTDAMFSMLDKQQHRRFLKTHLPADALQAAPNANYIYIARDGIDTLWSWYEFHCSYTDPIYEALNETPGLVGPPFERPGTNVVEYFHEWLDRDGFPAWPFFSNTQSWWNVRGEKNVLLLHFNDLKADLAGQMRRIADFLEFDIDAEKWPAMIEHCTFDYMQKHADDLTPRLADRFKGGARSLINKGTNSRWRDTFSESEVTKYYEVAAKNLSPQCASWLKTGGLP